MNQGFSIHGTEGVEMAVKLIDRFAEQAPAALMFRTLFARVFSDRILDQIFAKHRQRQLEGDLLFSTLLRLLVPVVTGSKSSVHAAYQAADLEFSSQSIYNKLKGVEVEVSAALLRTPVVELQAIQEKAGVLRKDVIPGYHTFIIDGKKFNGTEHRLKETRNLKSAPLPGMAIALLDTRTEMFVDIECELDAYRCERKILEPMMERLEENALYIADRNFCDGPLISAFLKANAFFIVRHHGRSPSWREIEGESRHFKGKDARDGEVYEQVIEVQLPDSSWHRVRRITVKVKGQTRNGNKELHLLTNLPKSVRAARIANAYAERWTIETCLGYLSQALNAEINTLCYPAAAELCFCLALTLFNMMSTIKSILGDHGSADDDKVELSYYYLAQEISECHVGLKIAINDDHWKIYSKLTLAEFVTFFNKVAAGANLKRYRKHKRGPKKVPPKRESGKKRAHVSTQRILLARE